MTERDPIVAVALARRPVPDHAPGFWQELEARLAASPIVAEPDEATEAAVISLTDAPSRRRRRWLVLAAGVVSVAAVAIALVGDDDKDPDTVVITEPDTVTTTASAPTAPTLTTSPAPTVPAPTPSTAFTPVPAPNEFPGVWPFTSDDDVAQYMASGSTEFADPAVVVERFASEVIGVVNPAVSEFIPSADGTRAGTVEVRTRTEGGDVNTNLPPTVVSVIAGSAGASEAAPWLVTGATSDDVTIDSPVAGAAVTSPLNITGQAAGYEGTVVLAVYSGGTALGGPSPTIAGNPDLGPYSVVVPYDAPPNGHSVMVIARTDSGAEFVGVPAFAVTRVVVSDAAPTTDPSSVVSGFLTAVTSGASDTAWGMVDPTAQSAGGGRAAFDAYTSDYAQDLAKLALQRPADYAVRRWSPTSENEPDVSVVTVSDPAVIDNVTAWAFAVAANGTIVSTFPLARDPAVDAVGWVGNTTPAGQPLEILVPTSAVAPTISIDQQSVPIEPSNQPVGGDPQNAVTFPLDGVSPGLHVVTLSFLKPDGLVHTEAHVMDVLPSTRGEATTTPSQDPAEQAAVYDLD